MSSKADSAKFSKMQSAKRLIALAICIIFIAASPLSSAFVLTHINHKHDHSGSDGNCAACVHLTAAENLLKHLSAVKTVDTPKFFASSAVCPILKPFGFYTPFFTLVQLKVKLNN